MVIIELLLAFVVLIFPLIALIDILKSSFREDVNKLVWVLVVILLPILGSLLYFVIGKTQKRGNWPPIITQ